MGDLLARRLANGRYVVVDTVTKTVDDGYGSGKAGLTATADIAFRHDSETFHGIYGPGTTDGYEEALASEVVEPREASLAEVMELFLSLATATGA